MADAIAKEMNFYTFSMLLTIASNLGYHFCQKSIDSKAPPFLSLAVTYGVGLSATIAAMVLFPSLNGAESWRGFARIGWASYALGIALVGLELGFLLVYRAGWKLSLAALYSNIGVTLLLIPIGMYFYREELNSSKVTGVLFSLVGLWLLGKK